MSDDTPTDDPAAPPCVGTMTIAFHDNGSGRPVPSISFDPVGRITPGLIDHYLPFICGHIEQAQARVRHAARNAIAVVSDNAVPSSFTPPRRRRA